MAEKLGHRPPLDAAVYKIRFRRPSGATDTVYKSDPTIAEGLARRHRAAGTLLYFARYVLGQDLT